MCDKINVFGMSSPISPISNSEEELSDKNKPESVPTCSSPNEASDRNGPKRSSIANDCPTPKRPRSEPPKTNDSMYACDENNCGKQCKSLSGLKAHKTRKHTFLPSCEICKKKIKGMDVHIKLNHPDSQKLGNRTVLKRLNKRTKSSQYYKKKFFLTQRDKSCTKRKNQIRNRNKKSIKIKTSLRKDESQMENQSGEIHQPDPIGNIPEINELDGEVMSMGNRNICSICDHPFTNQDELNEHELGHKINATAISPECPFCEEPCNSTDELEKHQKEKHELKEEEYANM